jgi:large subunit ribosomal protein L3
MENKPEAQSEEASTPAQEQAVSTIDPSSRERVALGQGRGGVLGIKAGMTHVYTEEGRAIPVTVIDLSPAIITQLKTHENDGYQGVQVGFLEKKEKATTRPERGHAKAAGAHGFYHYQEFRLPEKATLDGLKVGNVLSAGFVSDGDLVDVTSVSKGKGFQGVIKRHNFGGGPASHGASLVHRAGGSIGNNSDPAKVRKGKKMPGHMGHRQVTTQNLKVIRVDLEKGLMLIRGSIPGPKSAVVTIKKAIKVINPTG